MNLLHVKTNAVPDFTGTVTVYNQTGGSQTIAATDLVRPSDWNSNHKMFLTFEGNTTNSSTLSGTNIPIAGMGAITVGASNGSFIISGNPAWLTTAQPPGAYLTTARASNDAVGLNTALTANGVAWTVNSSGLSLNIPAFLTTAAQSNHSHNLATTTTNGSLIVVATTNSAGATIAVPPYLTTAQAPGAYLTTARASNDAIGLNTALTANGVSWTVNSSGLSLNVPAFLTTAAQSNHSHGNPTLALTNLTGTTASNSAGFTLSLSGAGGGVINQTGPNIADSAATITSGTVLFSNLNGVSFGLAGSTMTASHNGLTTAAQSDHSHGNPTLALTNLTGTTASASNGFTLSLSAAAPGGGAGATLSQWNNLPAYVASTLQNMRGAAGASCFIQPFTLNQAVSFDRIRFLNSVALTSSSFASTANTTFSFNQQESHSIVLYSRGTGASSNRLMSIVSHSESLRWSINAFYGSATNTQQGANYGLTYQNGTQTVNFATTYTTSNLSTLALSTAVNSALTGNKFKDYALATLLTPGVYYLAYHLNSTSTTQGTNLSNMSLRASTYIHTQINQVMHGFMGTVSNTTIKMNQWLGSASTAGSVTLSEIPHTAVSTAASHPLAYFSLLRSEVPTL
jgi:hypothetical protein